MVRLPITQGKARHEGRKYDRHDWEKLREAYEGGTKILLGIFSIHRLLQQAQPLYPRPSIPIPMERRF